MNRPTRFVTSLAAIFGLLLVGCGGANDDDALTLKYAQSALTQDGVTSSLTFHDDWGSGFCGSISIVNKGPGAVRHWRLELTRNGSDIGRQWRGLQVLPGDLLLVQPSNDNEWIPVGGTVELPFCGSGFERPQVSAMQVELVASPS
jgi:cellulase/cellobiase CelA1